MTEKITIKAGCNITCGHGHPMYEIRADLVMNDPSAPKRSPDEISRIFKPLQGLDLADMFGAFCPACNRNMNLVKWFCGEPGGWAVFVDGKKVFIPE